MTGPECSANPGTATEFPAHFAGISVTVPGLPTAQFALLPPITPINADLGYTYP
jgi:hypothetical protein